MTAYSDCPVCGHNTSAFSGACTAFVLGEHGPEYCVHDCSAVVDGESVWDRFARAVHGVRDEPLPQPEP